MKLFENKVCVEVFQWMKKRIYERKIWILIACLFFAIELFLLAGPAGWLREDAANYLTGEGGIWGLETQESGFVCCQEFRPEYGHLDSIGIMIGDGEGLSSGNAVIMVNDSQNEVLFETQIPYEQINMDSYTDIEMNLSLNPGQSYYLSVYLGADEDGRRPVLKVCGMQQRLFENIALTQEDELDETQLVTSYVYSDTLAKSKALRAVLICGLTAVGIAFGLPHNRWLRRMAGTFLLILIPFVLGRRLELLMIDTQFMLPFSMKWNIGLMYLFELILLLCSQSFRFSACASGTIFTLLYTANYFVYSYRGEALRLADFSAIRTAAGVIDQYSFRPNSHMAMAWCILILFLAYGAQTGVRRRPVKFKRIIGHAATLALGVALTLVAGYKLLYTDMLVEAGFLNTHGFDQYMNYHFDGYLVASFLDIQDSRVTKPQGYSVEKIEELLENAGDIMEVSGESEMPHIILIMNESFSDLRILGNLQISEDNLSYFNSLTDNTVRGYVNASVLGGGTANSEFEVFTGCSMGFLPPSYYAYQQCVVKETPSMISALKNAGYTTYSIHPENAGNWNRDRVYQYLGFDESLWIDAFPDAAILHNGVTDLETYKKVEELFLNRQEGERIFVFDLTIQNHGGYSQSDVERSVSALNVSSEEADIYLSLVREADNAFEQLITFFEKEEEPVIICMYGDHQPKLGDSFYESIFQQTEGLNERDKRLNKFKTPFIIWANYDIPEMEEMDIGMSYLGALLLQVADVPGSPFFSFLQQYMEEYPIVTVNGYEDSEGNHYNWSGDNTELPEYRMLQYNYLFDWNIVEWGF